MLSQPKTLTARGSVGRLEKKSDDMVVEFVLLDTPKAGHDGVRLRCSMNLDDKDPEHCVHWNDTVFG
jgi:hypothetical protein